MADDEGWELPKPRKRNNKPHRNAATSESSLTAPNPSPLASRPTRVVPELTVSKLRAELDDLDTRWRKSSCARNLRSMFSLREWTDVEEAVCVGVGSFSLDWENRWRSLWQLVLFRGVVDMLQSPLHPPPSLPTRRHTLRLSVHDPILTPLDITFLSVLNMSGTTAALLQADPSATPTQRKTFLYAPFLDWSILLPLYISPHLARSQSTPSTHKQQRKVEKGTTLKLYMGTPILPTYAPLARSSPEKAALVAPCDDVARTFLAEVLAGEGGSGGARKVPVLDVDGDFRGAGGAVEGLVVYWASDDREIEEA